jgi:hypothetical protein
MAIIAGVAAAVVAAGVVLALTQMPSSKDEPTSNFPITIDFARVLPYENSTNPAKVTRAYVMNIKLLYPEEGPPRPFYLLLLQQGESWDQLTTPQEWVKRKYHGFEVLSSSKKFDMFTEYYPFDQSLLPLEMRLYCEQCAEQWSNPQMVWQKADERITKIRGILVHEGSETYAVGFALGNNQIDTLPASGTVEFRLTDAIGVTLFETKFDVKKTDFKRPNDTIRLLRVPLGGKAFYEFSIPTAEIKPSPSGQETGFAFVNFILEDGRILSGGTKGVKLPPL